MFLQWLYFDAPQAYWRYRGQLTTAFYSFFSISLLGKTLFDPWRHDQVDVSRLALKDRLQAIGNNLMSRFIGGFLRIGVICTGLGFIVFINLGAIVFILAWYILPLLLLISIGYGIKLIIGL